MTETELRQKFAAFLLQDVGAIEGGSVHQRVVNAYNSQSKVSRGYRLKLGDAWCAGYVSGKAIEYNLGNYIPSEVSCSHMIEKAKGMGIWVEADDYEADIADVLMFDWEDDGKGDNTGSPNHVGYIVAKRDGYYAVWEGNMSRSGYPDHVGVRPVAINGKYIRGFITPRYDAAAAFFTMLEQSQEEVPEETEEKEEADMDRYKNLEEIQAKAGYAAEAVQKLVDGDILRGKGGESGLDLSEDLLRVVTMLDRLGLIPDPAA